MHAAAHSARLNRLAQIKKRHALRVSFLFALRKSFAEDAVWVLFFDLAACVQRGAVFFWCKSGVALEEL